MGTDATIYRFQVELSDIDRGVYEQLDLRVARHPSEDSERLVIRVLARALAHEEGLEFGRGLSNAEDAALWSHGDTGRVETWIDIGLPAASRLHRASKHANQLLVFTHKSDAALRKEWRVRKIHDAESIRVFRFPPDFIASLCEDLTRREKWYLTIQDGGLTVATGERTVDGSVEATTLHRICSDADGA